MISSESVQGSQCSFNLSAENGARIDAVNDVILVRSSNHIYAFAQACPHENTALRWRSQDQRFQCPQHHLVYRPDGTYVSGRATRNMDRFSLRLEGKKVIVDLSKLYRSDRQKSEWSAAFLVLPNQ